jgi:hypothetical protein
MNARARAILICALSVLASILSTLTAAAQPTYTVVDLGIAPEPVLPEPYNRLTSGLPVDFIVGNPSGQVIISRTVPPTQGASQKSFFWEPRLSAPLQIGHDQDTVIVAAISGNGFVAGTANGSPFVWSKSTGQVSLQSGFSATLYALAVNDSGTVVGINASQHPPRAVIWAPNRPPVFLNDLAIAGRGPWVGFEQARTISNSGVITGIGRFTTASGAVEPHYFALTPVPPSSGALDRSDWTASATEAAPGDPPAHAIDGDLNTRFSTGNAQHDSQGFRVTWPGDRTVGRIRMEVGPSTGDYPTVCGIWVTDTAGNVTFINCVVDGSGNVDVSFTPIPVQKIEVWQWGSSPAWWSIAEFNAYSQ